MRPLVLFIAAFSLFACGPSKSALDAGSTHTCNPTTDQCVPVSRCATPCTGAAPFCDEARGVCVECTATEGCSGATPHCNVTAATGAYCVECLEDAQCPGSTCSPSTRTCRSRHDAGTPDAGSACPTACTGQTPRCDAASQTCVQCLEGSQCGGGSRVCNLTTHRCELAPSDGGTCVNQGPPPACTASCNEGFQCVAGQCVLNGSAGPVQVTVRWDTDTDVDLHLDEPLPNGGHCEIYYGDTGGPSSSCGAIGELDLDSNAGCSIDGVDIENIIYPAGSSAPRGTYVVRVDYYDACDVTTAIPFEIEVRANGQTTGWCDVFQPGDADQGDANSGRVITTFVVP